MKVLICGAGGMLGGDVARAAELAGQEVVSQGHEALDVTDPGALRRAVELARADAVVNCAAYTDVEGAEQEPEIAMRVNADGARNVSAAAAHVGASVLYPSTDYVFDGKKGEPYVESDEPNPLGSYGASKLAGERETAAANARHYIVRTSWLFGTGGRNFVETMLERGSRRPELAVVADQVGSPTYTGHLAEGIVRLLAVDAWGTHHMAAGGECSWYDFAVAILQRMNPGCRVTAATTEAIGRPAARPGYSVLRSERSEAIELPDWRVGLDDYLAER